MSITEPDHPAINHRASQQFLSRDRKLVISSLGGALGHSLSRPVVALLPAFDPVERRQVEAMTDSLLELGCVELCCVGPEAEQLHDALDQIIEARGALDVVTTWDPDPSAACEYFLYGAGGGQATLLALISSHPELATVLDHEAENP